MYKWWLILLLSIILFSCETTKRGGEGDKCKDGGICNDGLICNSQMICEKNNNGFDCNPGDVKRCGEHEIGICKKGSITCSNDGKWENCIGKIDPTEEICGNGLDEDCDGEVDEGCNVCEKTSDVDLCKENGTGNGIDENCDGVVDEGCEESCEPGKQESCYTGPNNTENVGICHGGIRVCKNDGSWGECTGQKLPKENEICDGKDNDCDGVAAEDCECINGTKKECYTGPLGSENKGVCKSGITTCVDGKWAKDSDGNEICDGQIIPITELCGDNELGNNVDEDCDGIADNGCAKACQEGEVGECYSGNKIEWQRHGTPCKKGMRHCIVQAGQYHGQWSSCEGEVVATQEIAGDGIDNDCDGQIDEEVITCDAQPETCDGLDNDCDGLIDEGVMNACGNCGTVPEEVCDDGFDNDCDGEIDENCKVDCENENAPEDCNENWQCIPGTQRDCYHGNSDTIGVGTCKAGTQSCISGVWTECIGEVRAGFEICDNLDNDCDGQIDEFCGVNNCTSFEVCGNNIDDNCNGLIDENCDSEPNCINTVKEICDGLDNNCNGLVDENCGCDQNENQCFPSSANYVFNTDNPKSICKKGSQICLGGENWGDCEGAVLPQIEICDGLDNDCDGIVDDGFFVGQICAVGTGECQNAGTYQCSNGSVACLDNNGTPVEPKEGGEYEICDDGLDNDCDGLIDEDNCISSNLPPIVICPESPSVNGMEKRVYTLHETELTAQANDPNGDEFEYKWELVQTPENNTQQPSPINSLTTKISPDAISANADGTNSRYVLRFTATEKNTVEKYSDSCEVNFLAISEDKIHVELRWNNCSDMDLHMVSPAGNENSFQVSGGSSNKVECNYSNCRNDGLAWTGSENQEQYLTLDIDNIPGWGNCGGANSNRPENINVNNPRNNPNDIYRVAVYGFDSSDPGEDLKVKINCKGANETDKVREYSKSELGIHQWWKIANINWHGTYCTIDDL